MIATPQHIAGLSAKEKRNLLAQLLSKKASHTSIYPLSYNQLGIWFLYQLAPDNTVYNVTFSARIRSDLDLAALRRSFQALIDRHPSLRTTFHVTANGPVQHVHARVPVDFEHADGAAWSNDEMTAHLVAEAYRPFNLERGPLLRVRLYTRSKQDHVLLLAVHHIAIDFWSLAIILDELSRLYPAHKSGVEAVLPRLDSHYADYVRWQAEMLASVQGERLWDFWRKQLAEPLPVLKLPTDRPRPPQQTYCGASHEFTLDGELSGRLKALAKANGVTLYMVLLAAFNATLHYLTGQKDLLVATPMIGRNRAEFEGIVGMFTNPVVLRSNLSANPSFRALINQARDTVLGALEHQDYPTLLLVQRLRLPRDLSRQPLAQVMFVLDKPHRMAAPGSESSTEGSHDFAQGPTGLRMNPGGLDLESFPLERRAATLDLVMLIIETTASLAVSMRYNSDLFDPETISRIGANFETVLRRVVAEIELSLEELNQILGQEDRLRRTAARIDQRNANLQLLHKMKRMPVRPARVRDNGSR